MSNDRNAPKNAPSVMDTLLGEWPNIQRTDVEWDERAAATVKAATLGSPRISAGMSDDALFEQVGELEEDLIDAYVRGELDYPQSPSEERKLRLARALAFKKA